MLEKIRRPGKANKTGQIKKFFAYFVFGLICLVFVFFTPITSQLTGYGGGIVATVGQVSVRAGELDFLEKNLREQHRDRFNTISASEAQRLERRLKQNALSHLLNGYLVFAGAGKEGFLVSDQELRAFIHSLPIFQDKGQFIYSRYRAFLKSEYLSPVSFEAQIRRDIVQENWMGLFFKSVQSNQLENEKNKMRGLYTATARFAEMDLTSALLDELEPLMQKQNRKGLSGVLKRSGVKWQTVEAFSPGRVSIPQFRDNKKVQQAVFDYLPETGLIPQAIKSHGKIYIVDIVSFEEKPPVLPDTAAGNRLLNFDKPSRLFEDWLEFQKETIKVSVNEQFFDSSLEDFQIGN